MVYHTGVSSSTKPQKQVTQISSLDPSLRSGGRLQFERRITFLTLAAGFPAVALCAFLLWYGDYSGRVQWTVNLFLVIIWLGVAFNLKQRIVRPLQTLSNILAAIREGDYSIRGRRAAIGDALGEVMLEVNDLGQTLREQRLGAMEATALLRTVMAEIDVAVFAFDGNERLRLVNRAGERLLAQPATRLLGSDKRGTWFGRLVLMVRTARARRPCSWFFPAALAGGTFVAAHFAKAAHSTACSC